MIKGGVLMRTCVGPLKSFCRVLGPLMRSRSLSEGPLGL